MQKYIDEFENHPNNPFCRIEFKDGWFLTGVGRSVFSEDINQDHTNYTLLRFEKKIEDINDILKLVYYANNDVLKEEPNIIEEIVGYYLFRKEIDLKISIKRLQVNLNKRRIE